MGTPPLSSPLVRKERMFKQNVFACCRIGPNLYVTKLSCEDGHVIHLPNHNECLICPQFLRSDKQNTNAGSHSRVARATGGCVLHKAGPDD